MLSFLVAVGYALRKLLFWNSFELGTARILVGVFFLGALQMCFLGMIGEYIVSILTHVRNLPHVVERERVNF